MSQTVKLNLEKLPKSVAVLGATGTYGKGICRRALDLGIPVKAIARTPSKLDDLSKQYPGLLSVHQVALNDEEGLAEVFSGTDGVINATGAGPKKEGVAPRDNQPIWFSAMKTAGVKRFAGLNTHLAATPDEWKERRFGTRMLAGLYRTVAPKHVYRETYGEVDRLFGGKDGAAEIEWTLMRVGMPTSAEFSGGVKVDHHKIPGTTCGTMDVGDFALYCMTDENEFIHAAPLLCSAGKKLSKL